MQSNNPGKSILCNVEVGGLAVEKNLVVNNYYDQFIVQEDTITGLVLQAKPSFFFFFYFFFLFFFKEKYQSPKPAEGVKD